MREFAGGFDLFPAPLTLLLAISPKCVIL